jgi:hypothetical protein
MKQIRNRAAVYDDYWKGEIKEIRKSGLRGSDNPRYLVEVAWFYSKAQILAALQGTEYSDIRR